MQHGNKKLRFGIQSLFCALIALFFLSLGSDQSRHLVVRYAFGGTAFFLLLISPGLICWKKQFGFWTIAAFFLFIIYLLGRYFCVKFFLPPTSLYGMQVDFYLQALLQWSYAFSVFFLGYHLFLDRVEAGRFFDLLTLMGFLLALSAIPPLMKQPGVPPLYQWGTASIPQSGFFPSWVYFHPLITQYLIEKFAHVNYTGDVIAIGFFAALGLLVYHFEVFRQSWQTEQIRGSSRIPLELLQPFFLYLTAGLTMTSAIFLLFSRGTILCFSATFFMFLFVILLRFRSRMYLKWFVAMVLCLGLFNLWSSNLSKVVSELQTLSQENTNDPNRRTSFSTNKEGSRRALGMIRDYSVWGIGTGAYKKLAQKYAVTKAPKGQFDFADFESMCHYLQALAEHGVGAYIYFCMLIVFLLETIVRLIKIKSRFQFILVSALMSAIVTIFLHGAFNHLLERVSMASFTYALMGVCLAMLREDFDKASFSKHS